MTVAPLDFYPCTHILRRHGSLEGGQSGCSAHVTIFMTVLHHQKQFLAVLVAFTTASDILFTEASQEMAGAGSDWRQQGTDAR